jgi:hypothetical protein
MDCHHQLVVVMKTAWLGKIMELLTSKKQQEQEQDILKESSVPDGMKMPADKKVGASDATRTMK